jgi:hypothetical protein
MFDLLIWMKFWWIEKIGRVEKEADIFVLLFFLSKIFTVAKIESTGISDD